MSKIGTVVLLAALAATVPAFAADRAPEGTAGKSRAPVGQYPSIYSIPGVADNGGAANAGIATSITCTNPTRFNASVQVVIYTWNGLIVANQTITLFQNFTETFSTHPTVIFFDDVNLNTGLLDQGSGKVFSNNAEVFCTAAALDASPSESFAVELRLKANAG